MNISNNVPLSFDALEDGLSISFSNEILYRINGGDWKTLLAGENTEEVNKGSVVSFRHAKSIFVSGVGRFSINKKCNVYGTCSSIIPKILGEKYMAYRLFSELFYNCDAIVDASKLELPATTLAYSCYESMFSNCTSLVNAPELPATTLADSCYEYMFSECTSLVNAPELPATTLADRCYESMFYGCTKLNYIKAMFMTTPSTDYTNFWVYGVSSTGTFVKNKDATWNVVGEDGIPNGWTVETE